MGVTTAQMQVFCRRALGYGAADPGGTLTDVIAGIVTKAYQMVHLPAALPGETMGHQWSFNKGSGVFYTRAPYSTGGIRSITVQAGDTLAVVTGEATSWTTAAAVTTNGFLEINDQLYPLEARNSDTELTITSGKGPATAFSTASPGASYRIVFIDYSVTSTGAGNLGPITYAPNFGDGPIKVVADTIIDDLRQANVPNSGRPEYASMSGNVIKLWPVPDAEYQLRYQYLRDISTTTQTTTSPMPDYCDDCVYAAMSVCIAEHLQSGDVSSARAYFLERLRHAVAADKAIKGLEYGDFLGYNGDRSDGLSRTRRPRLYTSDVTVYQNNRTSL